MELDVCFDFSEKNFIVAGASSGMGRQVATELLAAGANVLLLARRKNNLDVLVQEYPSQAVAAAVDIRFYDEVKNFIQQFVEERGKINGTVYAAGISGATPFKGYKDELAHEIMDVNFWSAVSFLRTINVKKYAEYGCSNVLFSSISAHVAEKSLLAYSSSKLAMQAAVRTIAKENSRPHYRFNTVSPGWVHTEMTEKEEHASIVSEELYKRHLLGIGKAEDVSGLVLFLLSQRASWITGQDFVVDGGYSLGDL